MSKSRNPVLGTTVASSVVTDELEEIKLPHGVFVTNKTTGAQYYEETGGERVDIRPANPKPEKAKPVTGKLQVDEDGVTRFYAEDGGDIIDLTKALEAKAEEDKLSVGDKAMRDANKRYLDDQKRIEGLLTDSEKVAALQALVQRLNAEVKARDTILVRLKNTVLGQSLLLVEAQSQ